MTVIPGNKPSLVSSSSSLTGYTVLHDQSQSDPGVGESKPRPVHPPEGKVPWLHLVSRVPYPGLTLARFSNTWAGRALAKGLSSAANRPDSERRGLQGKESTGSNRALAG